MKKSLLGRDQRFKSNADKNISAGPQSYNVDPLKYKKKVAHMIPNQDRGLLDKKLTMEPGPASYDTTTGLSMCSSAAYLQNMSSSQTNS